MGAEHSTKGVELSRNTGEESGRPVEQQVASAVDSHGPAEAAPIQDHSEVVATARRRTFTATYKLRILRQADACTAPGELGALLRRESLYSSHLTEWRRARDGGGLAALEPAKRGPKIAPVDSNATEVKQLRRDNARLAARLERAELVIDIQKKVAALLGIPLQTLEVDGKG